jgi:hypothetical protein
MKKKKNGVVHKAAVKKEFSLLSLEPEVGITITPRSSETSEMYNALDRLEINQSYKMPMDMLRIFTNARVTHKRITNKSFIVRKLDSYNIRCWRVEDGLQSTRRYAVKKKSK